jgi:hypothetical protein
MSQPFVIVTDLVGLFIELVGNILFEWILRRKRERK